MTALVTCTAITIFLMAIYVLTPKLLKFDQ